MQSAINILVFSIDSTMFFIAYSHILTSLIQDHSTQIALVYEFFLLIFLSISYYNVVFSK